MISTYELSENERKNLELYKGLKQDPYFKHYMHTHLSYFSDKMEEAFRDNHVYSGVKAGDYLRHVNKRDKELIQKSEASLVQKRRENLKKFMSEFDVQNDGSVGGKLERRIFGFCKRKACKCLAILKKNGTGKITINKIPLIEYFPCHLTRTRLQWPLLLTDHLADLDWEIEMIGGGVTGQADAVTVAIAKAIGVLEPESKKLLREYKLLKTDKRQVEEKKAGRKKARKGYVYHRR